MQVQKVKVHHCFQVKKGFERDTPLSPDKCKCRQFISVQRAAAEVEHGLAQYVVVMEKHGETEETCNICGGLDDLKKTCQACGKTGVITIPKVYLSIGEDIVYISLDGKQNSKTTQVKKSPTIEKAHIERAYVNGNQMEQARIELYGLSIADFMRSLISGFEPPDDLKTHTGRKYDYGRNAGLG